MEANNKTRNELLDILVTFRRDSMYPYFRMFLTEQINWVSSLNSDADLYNPQNKEPLIKLKNFLKYPEAYLEQFIDLFKEYMEIKRTFAKYDDDEEFGSIDDFFTEIVSELEMILYRMPPLDYETMKENNREFYHDLNKYILKPERIEKMACKYGIDFIDYLDAIDV
jgi:hypothetical protein